MEAIKHQIESSCKEYLININMYPCLKPKAIVHVVHGMIDHQGRYLEFIEYLYKHQFFVVSHDHIGHGMSVNTHDDLGAFRSGTWETLVEDTHQVVQYMKSEYNLKYFVLAHSMGSFVLRTYINQYQDIDGLILSGTAANANGVDAGILLAKTLIKAKGRDKTDPIFNKIIFGNYNRHFEQRTLYDWLTRDTVIVDQYVKDPLTSFDFTIGSYLQLFRGLKIISSSSSMKQVSKTLPILLISGSQDPLGGYGKGITKLYLKWKKQNFAFIELKLYEGGRHEMLNEVNRKDVYTDIVKWLELRLRSKVN